MMVKFKVKTIQQLLLLAGVLMIIQSCTEEEWGNHYRKTDKRVDMKLTDALHEHSEYTKFLELIDAYGLDTSLTTGNAKTLFVPTNAAFSSLTADDTAGLMRQILAFHISPTLFQSNNIMDEAQLYTSSGKYVSITRNLDTYRYDSIPIISTSPLYLDGKYYELNEVAIPSPNLYEYMDLYSPFLKKYVDNQDTLFLNKNESTPIGYNDQGETVYDSVYTRQNIFELNYFPVSKEFRRRKATFLIFTQEQYDNAIREMAQNMGIEASAIPLQWQNEVFLPDVMKNSIYEGNLEYEEFNDTLINIRGDSTFIEPSNIDPSSRFQCSNGLVYNYYDFRVPEELYSQQLKYEGENFCDSLGRGRFVWKDDPVSILSDIATEPSVQRNTTASNDSIVTVAFKQNYTGKFEIEMTIDNVFPRDYILEWRANYRPSGLFKVYVNDVEVTQTSPGATANGFDLYNLAQPVRKPLVQAGESPYYVPDGKRNNIVGFLVEDILTEYGNVTITLEYAGSGAQSNNGFSLDYLSLTPIQN